MKKLIAFLLILSSFVLLCSCGDAKLPEGEAANVLNYVTDTVVIDVQNYGIITVVLDGKTAPKTVDNFLSLVKSGFYDGLTFHRIMEGFMIQGGDPKGDGTGGSGKTVKGEFSANGFSNSIKHVRGVISMARSTPYNSASSQFFIMQETKTHLDGNYAAFGFVTDGMDVVDKICADAKPVNSNGKIIKSEQPVINSIKIVNTTET